MGEGVGVDKDVGVDVGVDRDVGVGVGDAAPVLVLFLRVAGDFSC